MLWIIFNESFGKWFLILYKLVCDRELTFLSSLSLSLWSQNFGWIYRKNNIVKRSIINYSSLFLTYSNCVVILIFRFKTALFGHTRSACDHQLDQSTDLQLACSWPAQNDAPAFAAIAATRLALFIIFFIITTIFTVIIIVTIIIIKINSSWSHVDFLFSTLFIFLDSSPIIMRRLGGQTTSRKSTCYLQKWVLNQFCLSSIIIITIHILWIRWMD